VHEFLREMHREVFSGRRDALLLVGETPGTTVEDGLLFSDPRRGELDMVFTFEHVSLDQGAGGKFDLKPFDLRDLKATLGRWQAGLRNAGWNALYWDNHDQPRIVSRYGDDGAYRYESATMLATILHLHRGTPYVYQGEELGMTNAHFTSFTMLLPEHPRVYAFTRSLNGAHLLVLGNFCADEQTVDLARHLRNTAELVIGNYPQPAAPLAGSVTLRPWEALVLRGR
jgi:oligo-1,6-glucosidase